MAPIGRSGRFSPLAHSLFSAQFTSTRGVRPALAPSLAGAILLLEGLERIRQYFIVPAAMSLLAMLHMPYGYHKLLRLVVAASAGSVAWLAWQARSHLTVIVFGLLALVYNSILPLASGRPVWQ